MLVGHRPVKWGTTMKVHYKHANGRIHDIVNALKLAGYTTLDQQAKALGLHRSTTWTIIKDKHKVDRLSMKTINRILTNPDTPPAVRGLVQRYVAERQANRADGTTQS